MLYTIRMWATLSGGKSHWSWKMPGQGRPNVLQRLPPNWPIVIRCLYEFSQPVRNEFFKGVEREMKQIEEQTYYEILEVNSSATAKEIQRAYEQAKETYHSDSLAIYSLFSEEEVNKIQASIEEAYRVLMDEALRKNYDQSHPQMSNGPKWEQHLGLLAISPMKKASLSFTDVSINAEEEIYRGKTLKEIRERIGIDLKTISAETKINIKILEWIEEEIWEKLPPPVYLKGFLKSYAQSLGLEPQKVVEGYFNSLSENKKDHPSLSSPSPLLRD